MVYIVIALGMCYLAYLLGYKIGYHDCYNFLKEKLEEFKQSEGK